MPERDNDRLEEFFRKATSQPDVSFQEDDWKKLEARLDAGDAAISPAKRPSKKFIVATSLVVLVMIIAATWLVSKYDLSLVKRARVPAEEVVAAQDNSANNLDRDAKADVSETDRDGSSGRDAGDEATTNERKPADRDGASLTELYPGAKELRSAGRLDNETDQRSIDGREDVRVSNTGDDRPVEGLEPQTDEGDTKGPLLAAVHNQQVMALSKEQIRRDWMLQGKTSGLRYEQKATVILPGAEEGETGVAESVAGQEETSERHKYAMTPRLSLLLSFAPDFSGTSLSEYSTPGRAFGGMIHYHFWSRWSVAAGVIKNYKQYTGAGEDYTPPEGYWKYYTNGRIPNTIDGECSVLEFPVMVQYSFNPISRNRFLVGVGTSSYMMLSESYRYHFDEPNPGAREGWASQNRSSFSFNMLNFTLAYERQVTPGLTIGVEPYLKIPLEEIGWTNLKLFSTGASVSMRYVIFRKKPAPVQSRAPD